MGELYCVEGYPRPDCGGAPRRAPGEKPADHRRVRAWLREKLGLISQKTKLAEAIRYALSRWGGLTLFLDDGCIEIDSNTVERSIRPIALNRKKALFAGSDGGAEQWTVIASLIVCRARHKHCLCRQTMPSPSSDYGGMKRLARASPPPSFASRIETRGSESRKTTSA
ncbi:IS66 family transposase [Mesorhizobium argentiipisi]|uniref:IS66 family transposase n=1 Tax=Mesorhizobium argentiipisi TaxID=3015175 RepID=UPI0039F5D35C